MSASGRPRGAAGASAPTLAVRGGIVIDATGRRRADVLVRGADAMVLAVGDRLEGDRNLDASGCFVAPGLVDLHAHLREPGREEAETVETGARAAALGGFTAVVAMPNTDPAVDCAAVVREVQQLSDGACCAVHPSAAITVGRRGDALTPMAELVRLGVRIFTDDGDGVQDAQLMRRALEYAGGLDHLAANGANGAKAGSGGPGRIVLAQHCEVAELAEGGHMNEGEWSSRLGIPGQPAEAEELMVMRDIALARLTGSRIHFQHLSTAGSAAMVRAAKQAGLPVTAEAAPHHFTLTEACCAGYDTVFKVNPPLRTQADVDAIRAALADGTIDAIATDHAPHTSADKDRPFETAPPGMLGLETALALALTELGLPVGQVLAALSWKPAAVAGLQDSQGGPVAPGAAANICVIDPDVRWSPSGVAMASLSRNTPYEGRLLRGRVRHTICAGEAVVVDGEAQR